MIIEFIKDGDGRFTSFHTEGHADYDDPGFDIVCAAVSVLTINFVNSVDCLTDDSFIYEQTEDGNNVDFKFDCIPSHDSLLLSDSYHLGIMELSKKYGDYIKVIHT